MYDVATDDFVLDAGPLPVDYLTKPKFADNVEWEFFSAFNVVYVIQFNSVNMVFDMTGENVV